MNSCLSAIFTRILVDEWGNAENDDKENDHKKTSEKKTQRNIGKEKTKITSYNLNDEEWGKDGDDEEQVWNNLFVIFNFVRLCSAKTRMNLFI